MRPLVRFFGIGLVVAHMCSLISENRLDCGGFSRAVTETGHTYKTYQGKHLFEFIGSELRMGLQNLTSVSTTFEHLLRRLKHLPIPQRQQDNPPDSPTQDTSCSLGEASVFEFILGLDV